MCVLASALLFGVAASPAQAGPGGIIPGTVTTGPESSGLTGGIMGTVTAAAGGAGIADVQVAVYPSFGAYPVTEAVTAVDGTYMIAFLYDGVTPLPADSYRIEFRDPSGNHVGQYYSGQASWDLADLFVVNAGLPTPGCDAALATAAHVTGTVTKAGGADPGGIWVNAVRSTGSGEWELASTTTTAATSGVYDLGGLPAGSYRIQFGDASGVYVTQCYNNKPSLDLADDVTVTAGATTSGVDATLVAGGTVSGTVTNASPAGLGSINVNAYRASGSGDWDLIHTTQTDADGAYELGLLPAGSCRIQFVDASGVYISQYFSNQRTIDLADDVVVTAGATTSGINAKLLASGYISGTVTEASGGGLYGISVNAYGYTGFGDWPWELVGSALTAADGTYELGGLPEGSYVIEFADHGVNVPQYYNNRPTREKADVVAVSGGETTAHIDATLVAVTAPTITSFFPATGPVGTSVTVIGTGFTGASAVGFAALRPAEFIVLSATQIAATVPLGVASGPISVTTPEGTVVSTADFTVAAPVTPTVTLKFGGLKKGVLKLGKRLTASGKVTPISLAGSQVTLVVQRKRGATWTAAKTAFATITATGAYRWKYKPAKKGAYRIQATIAATTTHTAAASQRLAFAVK